MQASQQEQIANQKLLVNDIREGQGLIVQLFQESLERRTDQMTEDMKEIRHLRRDFLKHR